MSKQSTSYITQGRRWARGWNRFEARTMNWLFGILFSAVVMGIATGVVIGIVLSFPWQLTLVTAVMIGLVALLLGVVVAKIVVPFIWEAMLTKYLEE